MPLDAIFRATCPPPTKCYSKWPSLPFLGLSKRAMPEMQKALHNGGVQLVVVIVGCVKKKKFNLGLTLLVLWCEGIV